MRSLVCLALVFCLGFVAFGTADFSGVITSVDGDTVMFKLQKGKGGKNPEYYDAVKLKVGKDAKIAKGTFDKTTKTFTAGDAIENGLKNDMFTKIDDKKGVRATITTDDDKDATELKKDITQILIRQRKGKGT